MGSTYPNYLISLFFFTVFCFIFVNATASPSKTFKYYNVEKPDTFKEISAEYGGYRCYMDIYNDVFSLCFKNANNPNEFTLSILMGNLHSSSSYHWVWDANRARPVGENATLTFGRDGNLVLADADGKVAWQTNTANKGVKGIKILPNGNMVLYDSKNRFIWQSFDYPSDTLLMGQSLSRKGQYKLVSRRSNEDITEGPYSMVLDPLGLSLYYKSDHSSVPHKYFSMNELHAPVEKVTFGHDPDILNHCEMFLDYHEVVNSIMSRIKWNCTLSFLRMDPDGNVRIYSFYNKLSQYDAWEVTFTLLAKDSWGDECILPDKCGIYGVCEKSQCVGCPRPTGLKGWWDGCRPKKLFSCKEFEYYKIEGVDHYSSRGKGIGPIKVGDCEKKCSVDCNCMGYFYHEKNSMCWMAYDLKTLNRVWNTTHVGYIKSPLS